MHTVLNNGRPVKIMAFVEWHELKITSFGGGDDEKTSTCIISCVRGKTKRK
jgi:hypothetical protein